MQVSNATSFACFCRVGEADAQQHAMMSGRWAARPVPFTAAQYEELEHQALIYKYLVAGVPVPPDLLLPIRRGFVYHQPARKRSAPSSAFLPIILCTVSHCAAMASESMPSIWLFIRIEGFRCPRTPLLIRSGHLLISSRIRAQKARGFLIQNSRFAHPYSLASCSNGVFYWSDGIR